jgi:hypothetical protein
VPAKERLWRDEEGAPAPSRQQPREGGEDRSIHRAIGDARIELALEDAHLVAEHHDLDVLVRLTLEHVQRAPGIMIAEALIAGYRMNPVETAIARRT